MDDVYRRVLLCNTYDLNLIELHISEKNFASPVFIIIPEGSISRRACLFPVAKKHVALSSQERRFYKENKLIMYEIFSFVHIINKILLYFLK